MTQSRWSIRSESARSKMKNITDYLEREQVDDLLAAAQHGFTKMSHSAIIEKEPE